MNGITKFVIGGVATSLVAMASHSIFGLGEGFISGLGSKAEAAVSAAAGQGITTTMLNTPMLERVVVLSGNADADQRERLLAAARAVPGIKAARWAEDALADASTAAETALNTEVETCQARVNAAIADQTIQFGLGSAILSAGSQPVIDAVATTLAACPNVTATVEGHTDLTGDNGTNLALSRARADTVVAALTAKGISAERLTAEGLGSTRPKVPGLDGIANATNRRIEFAIGRATATVGPARAPSSAT